VRISSPQVISFFLLYYAIKDALSGFRLPQAASAAPPLVSGFVGSRSDGPPKGKKQIPQMGKFHRVFCPSGNIPRLAAYKRA